MCVRPLGMVSFCVRGLVVILRIVDENVETATGQLRDLLFALVDTLWIGDFKGKDTDARRFKVFDHVGVSHSRNDVAAFSTLAISHIFRVVRLTLTVKLRHERMSNAPRRASIHISDLNRFSQGLVVLPCNKNVSLSGHFY